MEPEKFDELYPIGTKFKYYPIFGSPEFEEVETRSIAWALGHGEVVVKVTGRTSGVCISHLVQI